MPGFSALHSFAEATNAGDVWFSRRWQSTLAVHCGEVSRASTQCALPNKGGRAGGAGVPLCAADLAAQKASVGGRTLKDRTQGRTSTTVGPPSQGLASC